MKKIVFPLGIIGVVIFVLTVTIAGFFKIGYSQIWDTVSMLAARGEPTRLAVATGFGFTYLALLLIAIYSFITAKIKSAKIAGILLSLAAVFSIIQLFLPMDQWQGFRTVADKTHDWITVIIALSIIVAIYLFALVSKDFFRKASFWFSGIIALSSILSGWFLLASNDKLIGLFERLWILSFLAWIIFFSYNVSRAKNEIKIN